MNIKSFSMVPGGDPALVPQLTENISNCENRQPPMNSSTYPVGPYSGDSSLESAETEIQVMSHKSIGKDSFFKYLKAVWYKRALTFYKI